MSKFFPHPIFPMLFRPWLWSRKTLNKSDLSSDPLEEFDTWYRIANRCLSIEFCNAMHLSTIGVDGYPQGRMVLLKDYSSAGFTFFTNSESAKGRALAHLPHAALTFYWEPLHKQVRIVGDVQQCQSDIADAYFATRPRESQLGAWVSRQSSELSNRGEFEQQLREIQLKYKGLKVPRPPHWNGYIISPLTYEFWLMRPNRWHDRFVYSRDQQGGWQIKRLYP